MNMKGKPLKRKHIAVLLVIALIAGFLPLQAPAVSRASGYGVSSPRTTDGVTTWDCVWFGNYWQEDTDENGTADKNDDKTPIKWRVLSVNGDDAFLLADKNLDCQKYNDTWENVTWETCTMRSWLNGYGATANVCGTDYSSANFMDDAFTDGEQAAIKTTNVVNEDNPEYGTEGGNNTSDQVFLLSIGEAMNPSYGFTSAGDETATREAVNTAYVKEQGAWASTSTEYEGNGHWWLRSSGYNSNDASTVYIYGYVSTDGGNVDVSNYAARPALHLNLSSDSGWSYAGTVSADGGDGGEETPSPGEITTPEPIVSPAPAQTQNPQISPNAGQSIVPQQTASVADVTPEPSATVKPEGRVAGEVTGLKVTIKKKQAAVTWKKVTGARGYQIYYGTSKKFKKKKQRLVKKNKVTLKKLKAGKTYYVKVRAYTVDGNRKVYGKWSKAVKKKCKK